MTGGQTFSFSIDLPIRSEWANVDLLRTSVQNCFTAVFSDIDGCHALAMVTGELLENAIKYGDWAGNPGGAFRLRVWGEGVRAGAGRHAHVSVENPVKDDDPGVAQVLATLEWLKGFASPKDAYRAKLLEIARMADAPGEPEPSRLGLVRIAYEGNCALRAEVAGNVLRVTADASF
jgi:hypothetical protein